MGATITLLQINALKKDNTKIITRTAGRNCSIRFEIFSEVSDIEDMTSEYSFSLSIKVTDAAMLDVAEVKSLNCAPAISPKLKTPFS